MIGFLDVLLRGLALCGQALAVGGVFFAVLILRPTAREDQRWAAAGPRTLLLIAAGIWRHRRGARIDRRAEDPAG